MKLLQTNVFTPVSVPKDESLELVDVFDVQGKKTIELASHSSLTYLVIWSTAPIDIEIITKWSHCSCVIFGLFTSDAKHPVIWSLKISLNHSQTSANVDLISFLYDGAKVAIDGSIDISHNLDQVHGCLLEQNIVLGKNISLKTLPKLTVASHNVTAAHGAKIDTLDQQKLFYMMSRGLTKWQSQTLLVDGYIDYVLGHFENITTKDQNYIHTLLSL